MGDPSDPLSLNRYVYCNLDPVNFVDPTGFMGEAVLNFGRQLTNSAPHPYLRAAGMAIAVLGTAIILVETVPGFVADMMKATTKEKDTRKNPGKDGATSEHEVERDESGDVISVTHKVTKDGKVIHQHQTHVGSNGTRRQFPDEWVENPNIGVNGD